MKKQIKLGIILLFTINITAFSQQFGTTIKIGLTAAQINGDASAGYNKLGLTGGLKGSIFLSDSKELGIEMLYSQRGSQDKNIPSLLINLQYVEIPVIFTLKDWDQEDYYKIHFHGGLSYGRLFSASYLKNKNDERALNLNKNDISFLLGVSFFSNEHFGLEARYTRSINKLASIKNIVFKSDFISHFLTFNFIYKL